MQAQGGGVEESVPWAQMEPPSASCGHQMLDDLRDKLTRAEQGYRQLAFQ
jgi:hypothetical protein